MLPNASLPSIVNEEISLEGLEGSTLNSLWNHIALRLKLTMPLPPKLMGSIWTLVLHNPEFEFYLLLTERKPFAHFNRLGNLDPENGIAVQPSEFPGHRYAYRLVEANGIRGSCEEYDTRTWIPREELRKISCIEAEKRYGRKFVIVASQRMRESFLIIPNFTAELTGMQYCILEWIGRSRFSGETSHGKYSLVEISGDSSSLFYHRKVLSSAKLITRQNLSIRIDDVSIQGMVFHLPRYYNEMKTKQLLIVERVVSELKKREHFMADYEEIKLMVLNKSDAGKLFRSPEFQRFIKTDETVSFRTLYPNAPSSSYLTKRGEEKMIRVMRLIHPTADVYDLWCRDTAEEGGADAKEGFLASADSKAVYADIPLLQLAYNVIADQGGKGISQSEMAQQLGLDKLNARAVVKNLTKLKCIESMAVDEGRQRTSKFFIPGSSQRSIFEKEMSQYVSNQMNLMESQRQQMAGIKSELEEDHDQSVPEIACDMNFGESTAFIRECASPTLNANAFDSTLHDNFTTEVIMSDQILLKKNSKTIAEKVHKKAISELMLRRYNFIMELVKQEEAIEPRSILKSLKLAELAGGNQYTACNKSLMRLIGRLAAEKLVVMANVTLKREDREFNLVYVCDPKLTPDHPGLQSKLAMAKSRIVLQQTQTTCTDQETSIQKPEELRGYHGCLPKCPRMKLYHEYLFYTAHVQQRDARELDTNELESINLDGMDLSEISPIYCDTNDWRMFIPPLNLYDGYGVGWVLLTDVVVRMPIYVFCSICSYSFYSTALDYYLNHPIRKYTLLKDLPDAIRMQLLQKRRYIYAILDITKLLCYAGLLQMGPQLRKTRDQTYVYLNQYACLLNTTGSKDSYHEIEARKYPMIQFRLETMDDVQEYWDRLYDIAIRTKLNSRNTAIGRVVYVQHLHTKPAMVDALRVQTEETARLNDHSGQLPHGDEKGAAGFDTAMFMHLKTNWQKVMNTSDYRHRLDKHRLKIVRRSVKMKKKQMEAVKSTTEANSSNTATDQTMSSGVVLTVGRRFALRKPVRKRVIQPRKQSHRHRRECYDEVDRLALRTMNNLRVKWSRAEDQILVLCRVAQLYMYTTLTMSCPINSCIFRDVLHWANVRSANKTSRACQRRVLYMVKKVPGVADTIRTCLEEAKQNALITERFGPGFAKKLRERFDDMEDYVVASRIHFVQLVHMVRQLCSNMVRGNDGGTGHVMPRAQRFMDASRRATLRIPATIDELYRKFNVTDTSSIGKQLNYASDPTTLQELQMYKLTILMHSAVTYGRTTEPLQNVYREYSESILAGAMRLMRNYHLVSLNKKLKGVGTKLLVTHTSTTEDRELYHVSIHYQQQLMTSLPFDLFPPIFDQYMQLLDRVRYDEMYTYDDNGQALVLLLSELLTTGRVDVQIDQEANYIEVRADTKEKVPFYSDVLEQESGSDAAGPQKASPKTTPFKAPSEKSSKPATSKVRFSSQKDVTFQYVSHPVEKLLKLPIEYFHFFCLLEQLQVPDRRLIVQTFKIDDAQPANCSLPTCICATFKAGGTRNTDLVGRCLSMVRGRQDLLARIRQHASDRAHRKNRVDSLMMFEVREENLLLFFIKYIVEFQQRWIEKQKRDVNRQNRSLQGLDRNTINMVELLEECLHFDEEFPEYDWLDRYEMSNVLEDEDVGETEQGDERTYDKLKALSEKVFKLHNFYEVMLMKVHIRMKNSPYIEQFGASAFTDRESYGQWNVPRCFLPDGAKSRRELLVKLTSEAVWPAMEQLERPLQEAMSVIERNANAKALLAYIESKQKLGASVLDLALNFPNHVQLKQHLQVLCGFKLLLRTGFRTITYVHWQFVEEWLTKAPVPEVKEQTEEQSTRSVPIADTSKGNKRKGSTLLDGEQGNSKKPRLNTAAENWQDSLEGKSSTKKYQRKHMLLAMAPWIRIDGLINKRLLFRWLTSILLYCVAHPGVPLNVLSVRYNMMAPFHLRQLLEMLQNYGCISLHSMQANIKKTIFSIYTPVTVVPATEFLPDEQTFVDVAPDALSTLSLCIGENRKYAQDLISTNQWEKKP
ncbi:general transcription factor 3C polypeptide 1 [Anopheles moucheti]|uniref:general transcription factor 3C polypeptide 1 n=1 Tax=Anopheles moucheti TaxID=186751 RepID=UPI0022F02E1A|nr:general transcription factor 3C polypeptide 1 [Anopheles moucheti]